MTQTQTTFVLPSTSDALAEVEKIVQEVCETYEIPEDAFGNILIALTEAVNNAIYHGNQSDPNKKVTIHLLNENNQLIFTVTDEGNGFEYQHLPDPTLPENISKIGGRGIFIIHQLADKVTFLNGGRTIQIHFNIPVLA
jgi:serine/threonine-protein kinase RsbW